MTDATPKQVEPESEVSKQVDTIRTWATKLVAVGFTVAGLIASYAGASSKANHAKDSSEQGFQDTSEWVKHLEKSTKVLTDRLAKVEAELIVVNRRLRTMPVRRTPAPPPAPVAVPVIPIPAPPPPLPANLDKALEQQQAKSEAGK